MKTYKVKNYKGNLVESLKKFSDSHKGMKIVEAVEDDEELKIKAEESEKIEETSMDKYAEIREKVQIWVDDNLKKYSEKDIKKLVDTPDLYISTTSQILKDILSRFNLSKEFSDIAAIDENLIDIITSVVDK